MERPQKTLKDLIPYVEQIEAELNVFKSSPTAETYLTVYYQIKSFNAQLKLGEATTTIGEGGVKVHEQSGFVDLFASKDDKSFDRTKWYFENILALNKTLVELRKLMTPEEKEEVEKKLLAEAGTAEHLALKHQKNGTNS